MSKEQRIEELLARGVADVVNREHLRKALLGKKRLRVKLGIDPTSPNIHIGRAVALWKLRAFQDLGHQVVFIVGDFTGLIGDTSDKDAERPMLTELEVKQNMKHYLTQAYKVLDKSKTEAHYNSKWLKKLGFKEIGLMANGFGLHEFSSRELIKKRLDAGKRVSLRELLYPLMQGYDSVAVRADVELGGSDQWFNLLAGRTIQPLYNQEPQDIMTFQLLEGTDGRKMSSSWGNVINLMDTPADMFGKIMSLRDELVERYFELATRVPLEEVKQFLRSTPNPRDQKMRLGVELVTLYHSEKEAAHAREAFIAQFSNKELPTEIPSVAVASGKYLLSDLLLRTNLVSSKGEARRMMGQGGVRVNQKQETTDKEVIIEKKNDLLLQVGKRKFVRIE
ncbi:MAG: tyrosine--tRNA ligase [Candidatus Doudnabacteria bacterium]|nr:tyrosine--tRNA ligase [Candidatus Doudnabacteria bacterium]